MKFRKNRFNNIFNNKLTINSSGQGEMVFRLLIGMIMGLAILVVIISLIDNFSKQELEVSEQRLYKGFSNALQNLTIEGSSAMVVEKDIILVPKTYSPAMFAFGSNISKECIKLQSSAAFFQQDDSIIVKKQVKTNIYYRCISQPDHPNCTICCIISFGKPLSPDDTC